MSAGLLAGVGRANITPPVGIPMAGFAGRGPAQGIHDELSATALALEQGGTPALVIAMDVLGVDERVTSDIRSQIGRATGIPENHILLCASHTHYSAKGLFWREAAEGDEGDIVQAYRQSLTYLVAGAAISALANRQPARIAFGEGSSSININRRTGRHEDPCDKQVLVFRIDREDGKPLAALVNYACHPVTAADHSQQKYPQDISADYIWAMRQIFERTTGAACLFLQGACGNINPIEMRASFEPARRLGTILGCDAIKAYETAVPQSPERGLSVAWEMIDLPPKSYSSREEGEKEVGELQEEYDRLHGQANPNPIQLWWVNHRLPRAKLRLGALVNGKTLPPVPAELTVMRIGDVALVTGPGEIFTEIGIEVKRRSPIPQTCYVAYTNGNVLYVPVPEAYPEGGYEVTHVCQVGPGAAPMIVEKSLELLGSLA